jgi:hypothetical protein
MDILSVEMMLLTIIVFISYLLPSTVCLFQYRDKSRLQKATTLEEFSKSVWFIKRRSDLSIQGINNELIRRKKSAKKRLNILFIVGLPSIWFCIYIILIKHIVSYYIKQKYNYDLPPTKITTYTLTLVLLSVWSSGVLLNKLFIRRVNDLLNKLSEFNPSK